MAQANNRSFNKTRCRPVFLNEMGSPRDYMARAYFHRAGDSLVLVAWGDTRDSAYAKLNANLFLYDGDYELMDLDG